MWFTYETDESLLRVMVKFIEFVNIDDANHISNTFINLLLVLFHYFLSLIVLIYFLYFYILNFLKYLS